MTEVTARVCVCGVCVCVGGEWVLRVSVHVCVMCASFLVVCVTSWSRNIVTVAVSWRVLAGRARAVLGCSMNAWRACESLNSGTNVLVII